MKPSNAVQSTTRSIPRRRHRTPTTAPSSLPPSVDLIGPPCPLSNLRPVYYAPLFPSLHSAPSILKNQHPYRLQEFATTSEGWNEQQQRLQQLKRQLHAQDLAWRLTRYRVDQFNQEFWTRTNTAFLRARDQYVAALPRSSSSSSPNSNSTTIPDVDLAPFYAQHLASTKKIYADYNAQVWKLQAALLWPAVKAMARSVKWKWEVWKAGGEQQ